jgi:hypothetical protein
MSSFTPIDFIAPKVEVSFVYDVEPADGWKAEWVNGTIKTVGEKGTCENNVKFVVCEIVLESQVLISRTLYDSDYDSDTDFAWRFSPLFTPLVNQLMKVNEPMEIDSQELSNNESETEDDSEYEPSTEGTDDETDDETSDTDECDDNDTNEDYVHYSHIRKTPSLTNRFFATMLVLSPWFASVAVVYHARDDIFKYLKNKYC